MGCIIHAGFQKCASSFLQKHVFPRLTTHDYIHSKTEMTEYEKLAKLFLPDISLDNPIHSLPGSNRLLSYEGFLTPEKAFPYYVYGIHSCVDIFIANVTQLLRSDDKILIVIRRQDSLIQSWLRFKSSLYVSDQAFFIDFPVPGDITNVRLKNQFGVSLMKSFDFFTIISRIAASIGKDRIHVIPFEDLQAWPARFYHRLGRAFKQDLSFLTRERLPLENASKDPPIRFHQGRLYRHSHPLRSSLPRFLKQWGMGLLAKDTSRMTESFRSDVLSLYGPGNKRLSDSFDLSLNVYDYF